MTLRPVAAADRDFLLELFATTRELELAALAGSPGAARAFVAQQFAAQTRAYDARYPGASHDVVVVDGRAVGQLRVDRGTSELRLVDVSLLPAHRSQGLGTRLLAALQDEARVRGQQLALSVLAHSSARRLYTRLGFTENGGAAGAHVAMRWRPN